MWSWSRHPGGRVTLHTARHTVGSLDAGTVAERTNAPALKAGGSQGPGVRIPPVPLMTRSYGGHVGESCDACGFVYDVTRAMFAGPAIVAGAQTLAAILGAGSNDLRRRPSASTWSALEYGCHVRDVLLVQRERVLLARRVECPAVTAMGRDERVDHDGYAEQDPVAVGRQLCDAAALFAGVLDHFDDATWERTLIYGYPAPAERDLAWVAVHTQHEVEHHLADVRAQITAGG